MEEKVGVENSFFFSKSAVKVLHKKRKWDIGSESDNSVEEDDDDEDDSFESRIIQGEAVQSAVKSLPKKNVSFTKKDKGVVMKLFDVVKKEVEMRVTSKSEIIAMSITKNILSEIPYYRPIKKKYIRRWCCRQLRKIQKSGKNSMKNLKHKFGVTYYNVHLRIEMNTLISILHYPFNHYLRHPCRHLD